VEFTAEYDADAEEILTTEDTGGQRSTGEKPTKLSAFCVLCGSGWI
jgi:hypothetical protein